MMKKFLMTATVPSMIGQFNMNNIRLLLDMGYEVHVACNFEDRSVWTEERVRKFEKQLSDLHVKKVQIEYARTPYDIPKLIKSYLELKKLIQKEKYAGLHCHTPVAGLIARLAARRAVTKTRIIYTAHGFHFYKGAPILNWLLYYPIEKWMSKYTDVLITINKEDYQRAKKKFHAKEIKYVPGVGIDVEKIQSVQVNRQAKRKELGIAEDDFFILSVGELNKNKNHEVVIRALAELKNPKIKYAICGQGPLKGYLEDLAEKLRVKEQLFLLGFRTDVIEICKSADVFVFPSKREGLSVALMEAMVCGLPCIVSDIRGNKDLVKGRENGYRWNIRKENDALIEYLKELSVNNVFNRQEGNAFFFDKKRIESEMKKIYEQLSEKKRMKVLHLLNSNGYSGAENVVIEIIDNMTERDIECLYVSTAGTIEEVLKKEKIPYYLVKKLRTKEVRGIIKKFNPDIIHAHDFTASILAAFSGKKIPVISHLHSNPYWIKKLNIRSVVYLFSSFTYKKILLVSKSIQNEFVLNNIMRKKELVVGNPISFKKILEKASENIQEQYDIAFLGRLTESKNPSRFINLIQEISREYPRISCVMMGDGELKELCIAEVQSKQLQRNITILGFLKNPYPILKNSKMLCMPSKWEGFGLAAVEALALGVPVICTPVGGLVDIVDESCGKLCKTDGEFLAEMKKMLKDMEYVQKKSENALKKAIKLQNIEQYSCRLYKIYNEVKG